MFGRKDWVDGEFEVSSVHVLDESGGVTKVAINGRLVRDGQFGADVSSVRSVEAIEPWPPPGFRAPARWRVDKPTAYRIDWGPSTYLKLARIERAKRAAAMGIDPATLDDAGLVPEGASPIEALLYWATSAGALPDGTIPMTVTEADTLNASGERADATVLAIEFLRGFPPHALPSREASIANVALEVTRRSGDRYRVIARFGFGTIQRRDALGHVGAVVPMLVDPAHPQRVTYDRSRLEPIND